MSKLARACAVAVAVATSLAGGIAAAQIQGGVARKAAPPAVALGVPVAKANVGQRSSASVGSGSPLSFASGQPALRYLSADLPTAKDPVRREAVKDSAKEPNVSARGAGTAGSASTPGEFAPAPGVLRANMPPVTFAEAQRVLQSRVLPTNVNQGVTAAPKTSKTSTLARMKIAGDAAASGPASIAELARALRHHPDLIYQYVRNNVEYYPTFGLQKGALGAVLDNQATAHDQRKYPSRLDDLLKDTRHQVVRRYLRRVDVDPMTSKPFTLLIAPQGGIWGVASSSPKQPMRLRSPEGAIVNGAAPRSYRDWHFVYDGSD
jgi:hypothetical protein